VTPMPRNTVAQVLECFDDEFAEVAAAFARGEYLLWLGSGISRDVVPDVPTLLRDMLEFLQTRVVTIDPTCRFKAALVEVLDAAGGPAAAVDPTTEVASWPNLSDIVDRLVNQYSHVLDVRVENESADYLVWSALDVPLTYGAQDLEPDVEHLCIAILMMEGVVRSAPTTNWDGLVEKAVERLSGDSDSVLKVVVRAADFMKPDRRAELVKFHGCAVRARQDPAEYRQLLIGRISQISGWTEMPENQMMKNRLGYLFGSRPALIVGLSAQDANIQTVFHMAIQNLSRTWPATPPAVVFAEHNLRVYHKLVMKVIYGDESFSTHGGAIASSALLGAYAKPALLGLMLFTLADKLSALIGHISELDLPDPDVERIRGDVRGLRDAAGARADLDNRAFVDALILVLTLALWVFRSGDIPNPAPYPALSTAPIAEAAENPDFPREALGRFALAYTLLGRGLLEGQWTLETGSSSVPADGVVRVRKGVRTSKVFVVRGARVLSDLQTAGIIDMADPEVMVAQAEAVRKPATRSPRPRYGRSGTSGARLVDLENMYASVSTADDLFENFVLAGAL
jgi:SIR2-like domain